MSDQAKNNNKASLSNKIQKQAKKSKPKNKAIIQEVIDLQVDADNKNGTSTDFFMNDLVKKCNSFFTWISNTQSNLLVEQLWKNKMLENAALRFPELSFNELNRLVQRDWRYMSEEDRMNICQKYGKMPTQQQLEIQIGSYSLPH